MEVLRGICQLPELSKLLNMLPIPACLLWAQAVPHQCRLGQVHSILVFLLECLHTSATTTKLNRPQTLKDTVVNGDQLVVSLLGMPPMHETLQRVPLLELSHGQSKAPQRPAQSRCGALPTMCTLLT